jgi:hypothetical protein
MLNEREVCKDIWRVYFLHVDSQVWTKFYIACAIVIVNFRTLFNSRLWSVYITRTVAFCSRQINRGKSEVSYFTLQYSLFVCFLLSFFLSLDLFLPNSCRCGGLVLHLVTFTDSPHSVGVFCTSGWPVAETLLDNLQHSQETDIHAPGGIRTPSPSNLAAAGTRLRPRSHRHRPFRYYLSYLRVPIRTLDLSWWDGGSRNWSAAFTELQPIKNYHRAILTPPASRLYSLVHRV